MARRLRLAQEILNIIYPVGSIYLSVNSTNPSTLFGGTWERVKGKFLLGADDNTYINGATGGEATHTLTISEMPTHNHNSRKSTAPYADKAYGLDAMHFSGNWHSEGYKITQTTADTGGGQAHNNMPPYLAVYIWKRTN